MNKISLIIAREYLTRVRKKSFIIMTFVGPMLFALMFIVPTWLATRGGDEKTIQVIDESGLFQNSFEDTDELVFKVVSMDREVAKRELRDSENYGLLYIPAFEVDNPQGFQFYSVAKPSVGVISSLERTMRQKIETVKLEKSGLDQAVVDNLRANVSISTISITEQGEQESSSLAATGIGYISSLLIYFFIFFFGAQIMRGVIEEKTSRIVEVIISSVKPFQLMLGKIIGVGAVGLTQFLLWVLLTFAITTGLSAVFGFDPQAMSQMSEANGAAQAAAGSNEFAQIMTAINSVNIPLVIISFVFYFVGGYLLYGSLFAAVGSAVDSEADSQQFMFPVTIPLIISIVVLGAVLNEPHGPVAFWMSMIPLTSPVVMMMRIPFGVPEWQLALSIAILIGGFLFTTWLAARIYRVGILMHGTKVTYKTMAKWFTMKN